jgi:thiol-disulfide isomerase/thioredoxin
MKNFGFCFSALVVLFAIVAFNENQPLDLMNKEAPLLNISTDEGVLIDTNFYKGKVTLLNFMYFGCKPCLIEIPTLNKICSEIKSPQFQVLSIAAHSTEQIYAFLSDSNSIYSSVRKKYKIDEIRFKLVAECESNIEKEKSDIIELMCNTISKEFHVQGYPTTFLIDQKGYVRKVFEGFSVTGMDSMIERNMKTEILKLIENN